MVTGNGKEAERGLLVLSLHVRLGELTSEIFSPFNKEIELTDEPKRRQFETKCLQLREV